ncbi:MAG: AmmeMemoRadiSam system radical SAM enzyme [Methanomassiliicoccus sp.]|nr:AmmeMemoRadiSam system radical SAM enzyme [Methanomassiliicoccus sp.]
MERQVARWWHDEGEWLRCDLCPHRCAIEDGGTGRCGARQNVRGTLITRTYGTVCARAVDVIEKKPIFHYRPGSKLLSLGTFGCNLTCACCQNAALARSSGGDLPHLDMAPEEVVNLAVTEKVQGIAWTFNEPTVWSEFIIDTAELARPRGLFTMINTNGYILAPAAEELMASVDVANIDIKGFTDRFYRRHCGGSLQEVLDTCLMAKEKGVHVELTCLLIPGLNDSAEEVADLSRWVVDNMGTNTPLFFYRFHPAHELSELPVQSMEVMERSVATARRLGLRHVYLGGVTGEGGQDTLCPSCGFLAVERTSLKPSEGLCLKGPGVSRFCPTFEVKLNIEEARCPRCGTALPIDLNGRT